MLLDNMVRLQYNMIIWVIDIHGKKLVSDLGTYMRYSNV
jgi:hypothetical protein